MATRLLLLVYVLALAGAVSCAKHHPSVVMITLDTTRRDHLTPYGYPVDTSPALARLAEDSVVYERAYAVSSWTLPTHASLFTGRFPSSHGAVYDEHGPLRLTKAIQGPRTFDQYRVRPLSPKVVTLAEVLSRAGWATKGIAGGPWLKRVFGLSHGFESWDDSGITRARGRPAADVTRVALHFVDSHADEPFFLFCNYYDPHFPLLPPKDVRDRFLGDLNARDTSNLRVIRALYDAEIRTADDGIGRILQRLRDLGLYDEAYIIVTADHGQLLGEHGAFGHGFSLSQPEIHVPLLVKFPASQHRVGRVRTLVQQVDILPTLLKGLGLPVPSGVQGGTLRDPDHPIVAEVYPIPSMSRDLGWRQRGDWRALIGAAGRYKLLWNSRGRDELIDLERDPSASHNLWEQKNARAERMEHKLESYLASLPEARAAGPTRVIDEKTRQDLEGLGYLEGGRDPGAAP